MSAETKKLKESAEQAVEETMQKAKDEVKLDKDGKPIILPKKEPAKSG